MVLNKNETIRVVGHLTSALKACDGYCQRCIDQTIAYKNLAEVAEKFGYYSNHPFGLPVNSCPVGLTVVKRVEELNGKLNDKNIKMLNNALGTISTTQVPENVKLGINALRKALMQNGEYAPKEISRALVYNIELLPLEKV